MTVTSSPSFAASLDPQRNVAGAVPGTINITTSFDVSDAATEQRSVCPSESSRVQPDAPTSTCAAVST